jgi:hypothetical protein
MLSPRFHSGQDGRAAQVDSGVWHPRAIPLLDLQGSAPRTGRPTQNASDEVSRLVPDALLGLGVHVIVSLPLCREVLRPLRRGPRHCSSRCLVPTGAVLAARPSTCECARRARARFHACAARIWSQGAPLILACSHPLLVKWTPRMRQGWDKGKTRMGSAPSQAHRFLLESFSLLASASTVGGLWSRASRALAFVGVARGILSRGILSRGILSRGILSRRHT